MVKKFKSLTLCSYWYSVVIALPIHLSRLFSDKAYCKTCFDIHKLVAIFYQSLLLLSTTIFNDVVYM